MRGEGSVPVSHAPTRYAPLSHCQPYHPPFRVGANQSEGERERGGERKEQRERLGKRDTGTETEREKNWGRRIVGETEGE